MFRGGLGTLTEIAALKKPAICVPKPGHQEKNATFFRTCNAVRVVGEKASPADLQKTIEALVETKSKTKEMITSLLKPLQSITIYHASRHRSGGYGSEYIYPKTGKISITNHGMGSGIYGLSKQKMFSEDSKIPIENSKIYMYTVNNPIILDSETCTIYQEASKGLNEEMKKIRKNNIQKGGFCPPCLIAPIAAAAGLSTAGYMVSKSSSSSNVNGKRILKRKESYSMKRNGKQLKKVYEQKNNLIYLNGKEIKPRSKDINDATKRLNKKIKECLKSGFNKC
mgnify:CR=1 FL=1